MSKHDTLQYLNKTLRDFRDIVVVCKKKKKTDKYKTISFILDHWLIPRLDSTIKVFETDTCDNGLSAGGLVIQKGIYDPLLHFFKGLI